VHAAVAATAWVIGKENVSSKINISGLGCGRAVRDRIAPAIDDVLSPAAGSEKANAPHQSAPVNRKRKDRLRSFWVLSPKWIIFPWR
jgi:hypothetical protein